MTRNSIHPNVWFPFTSIKNMPAFPRVVRGDGAWLETEDGKYLLDLISSWWVNIHGHAHPEMVRAIHEQARKLEQVIFAELTHNPAEKAAEELTNVLPGDLEKVFYSDNGSTAVEVALKMAYQYWVNVGEKRKTFIAFEGAYHGDTIGAMSVGARSVFTEVFQDLLFDVERVPYPETWMGDQNAGEKEDEVIARIEDLLNAEPDKYAGIIIEPLIQGAGGMRMCREEFLQKLHWVNRQFNTLLIFDEVMTGFGRTGEWFASTRAQVEPDIICLAKGFTGGYLPVAATVASTEVFNSFVSDDPMTTFYHGHSFTANPIGCAAAVKSLELMHRRQSAFMEMDEIHHKHMDELSEHPLVTRPRVMGTVAAFDVRVEEEGYLSEISPRIRKMAKEKGLLLRPLGNIVYILPPYCITEGELADSYATIWKILDSL